jgi:hypothetical protein
VTRAANPEEELSTDEGPISLRVKVAAEDGSLYPVYPHDGDQVPSTSYSTR